MTTSESLRPMATGPESGARTQISSIQNVLVCLDRSVLAESCLQRACVIADAFRAKLTLLHVLASPEGDQSPNRPDALDWELTRREAARYLEGLRDKLATQGFARERIATEVTQGRPAERIVALARGVHADLTVLSSHGEGGLDASALGSTVQRVLALAPGSVLIAPPDTGQSWHVPPRRIVVAVDGSLRAQSVLPRVTRLAQFFCAEVVLVHVVSDPKATAVLAADEDLELARSLALRLQAAAERYLTQLRERLFSEVSDVEVLVLREPDQRRALLDVANQKNADLLVLAAHGSTCDAERPFGSVAAYAVSHARLPLLVLQDLPLPARDSARPQADSEGSLSVRASFDARTLEET